MDAKTRKYIEWLIGSDTGVSSTTIMCTHLKIKHRWGIDAPYDPSDFGRCYRLLEQFPELRKSFPKVARKVKSFRGILKHWDELCELYRTELAEGTGKAPRLYARIKELRAQG